MQPQKPTEDVVTLTNRSGQRLYGILHLPCSHSAHVGARGVHILNPGLKNRVAPNRLNVKIARTLCDLGYPVLRSDPRGIGDSEGQLGNGNAGVLDLWLKIQKGALVEDTLAWNDFFSRRAGLEGLTLVGQCGGGVTALLAAAKDKRVDRVVLIDTPFRTVPTEQETALISEAYNSSGEILREGFQNLFQANRLRKLLAFRVNWRLYLRALVFSIRDRIGLGPESARFEVHERFNWPMAEAFRLLLKRGAQICFLYAENDFSLKEFSSDFHPHFLEADITSKQKCRVHIIPHANHIYTEPEWQSELFQQVRDWLTVQS